MAAQRPASLPHLGLILGGDVLVAQQGGYDVTGQNATLTYSAGSVATSPAPLPHLGTLGGLGGPVNILSAAQGSYSITGQDIGSIYLHNLIADQGTYTYFGQVAILQESFSRVKDPGPLPHIGLLLTGLGAATLTADTGIYSIVGSDNLNDFQITADTSTYSITGQDANLTRSYLFACDVGTYTISGQDAAFAISGTSRTMLADQGSYTITGNDANLPHDYPMPAAFGFYGLAGQAAILSTGFIQNYSMPADFATYAITGNDAVLTRSAPLLDATTGYYGITGYEIFSPSRKEAGRSRRRKRERYIARYKGVDYTFETKEEVEAFFRQVKTEQSDIPKVNRAKIKLTLAPEFKEEVEEVTTIPARLEQMPPTAAMAFIRKIEQELATRPHQTDDPEEDEILSWLL